MSNLLDRGKISTDIRIRHVVAQGYKVDLG